MAAQLPVVPRASVAEISLTTQQGGTIADVKRRGRHRSTAAALRYQHGSETRDVEITERLSEAAIQHRSGAEMARGVVAA